MNISVDLPKTILSNLDAYARGHGISRNRVIQRAVKLLLWNESNKKWGVWINHIEPNSAFSDIEELRKDMKFLT